MKDLIKFVIEGTPQVKKRPRFARTGNFVKTYTPIETTNYENWVKLCYKNQIGDMYSIDEALSVKILAYFDIPKAFSKVKHTKALSGELLPHNAKDVDNIAKIILDALNGIAYADDHYITSLQVIKRYSDIPRVEVEIEKENYGENI